MTTITVTVKRHGSPVSGRKITLAAEGFDGGLTSPRFTDSKGVAAFEMGDRQGGYVFVDGVKKERWGAHTAREVTVAL